MAAPERRAAPPLEPLDKERVHAAHSPKYRGMNPSSQPTKGRSLIVPAGRVFINPPYKADAGQDAFAEVKATADLREYADAHLERRGRSYVCPLCGSGTHANGTPALSITPDGTRWRCFSCGEGGDVFDLAGAVMGTGSRAEQLAEVAGFTGVDLPRARRGGHSARERFEAARARVEREKARSAAETARQAEVARNRKAHAAAIERAQANIADPVAVDYLEGRGISLEQAKAWGLGYAKRSHRWKSPRIIIPYPGHPGYHIDRAIDPEDKPRYFKWPAAELGPEPLWNPQAVKASAFVLAEGQFDALSVQSCGFEAVSCGGSGGTRLLVHEYRETGSRAACVIMTDTDEAGRRQAAAKGTELSAAGIPALLFAGWPMDGEEPRFKDPAEWFSADRAGMTGALLEATGEALKLAGRLRHG